MKRIITITLLILFASSAFADSSSLSKIWDEYSKPKITKPRPVPPKPVVDGEWPIYLAQSPAKIPLLVRKRDFVPPETVGVDKNCPFPTVKDPVCFECPKCALKMKTHLVYPFLPACPRDKWIMNEIKTW